MYLEEAVSKFSPMRPFIVSLWATLSALITKEDTMSDNVRRYRAVRKALNDLYPFDPQGNLARHLNTLAGLISGIVGSQKTSLPHVAGKVPDGTLSDSRVKRFTRFISNEGIDLETYYLPYAEVLLATLSNFPLVLVMDGSAVGRNCVTLILNVVYKKRALPIAWIVIKGKKGHFSEESHIALVKQVRPLIPQDTHVIFLGDGEFDGTDLQGTIKGYNWQYVCATAKNTILAQNDEEFSFQSCGVKSGEIISFQQVTFTRQGYGPVTAIAWWEAGYEAPLYLVTNIEDVAKACAWYRKRFRIETFFSDQKSRGFHLHKSHLSDPERLCRLMMGACLGYIWIIFLGVTAMTDGWHKVIHRADRCDLSLFQMGLRLLEHLLNEEEPIPVAFHIDPPELSQNPLLAQAA